ncbi:MAG: hypothetical protein M1409_05505 [Actinobacteria bacterium]|nr:hypothetical protein [Actinomycetota bacterium]
MNNSNSSAYELFLEGRRLSENKNFLKAIMLFEEAKKIEPQKGSIREALAMAYYNCHLFRSAKNNFLKAIKIDATNDYAHYGLALCLIKEGKINVAMGHLKMAFAMKPKNKVYEEALKKYSSILKKLK